MMRRTASSKSMRPATDLAAAFGVGHTAMFTADDLTLGASFASFYNCTKWISAIFAKTA